MRKYARMSLIKHVTERTANKKEKHKERKSHRQTATNQSSGNRLPMTDSEPLLAVSCQPSRRGRRGRWMALDWPHHSSTTRHQWLTSTDANRSKNALPLWCHGLNKLTFPE